MDKNLIFLRLNVNSKREIIEIGAVKLTKEFKLVSEFSQVVMPHKKHLCKETIAKTNLTEKDLKDAGSFNSVYSEFYDWVGDLDENAFIFWGKSTFKILRDEIVSKNYIGDLRIEKYFNYHSYLETKSEKRLSFGKALDLFNVPIKGNNKDALDFSKNLARLYIKVINTSDVNLLWFEGKITRIIRELNEMKDILLKYSEFNVNIEALSSYIDKYKTALKYSDSYSSIQREEKLTNIREQLDTIEEIIEEAVLLRFKKETMVVQWSIMKHQVHDKFKSKSEFMNYWENIKAKYEIFRKNKSGTYSIQLENFQEMFNQINQKLKDTF